jgi:hypothetical protein
MVLTIVAIIISVLAITLSMIAVNKVSTASYGQEMGPAARTGGYVAMKVPAQPSEAGAQASCTVFPNASQNAS